MELSYLGAFTTENAARLREISYTFRNSGKHAHPQLFAHRKTGKASLWYGSPLRRIRQGLFTQRNRMALLAGVVVCAWPSDQSVCVAFVPEYDASSLCTSWGQSDRRATVFQKKRA